MPEIRPTAFTLPVRGLHEKQEAARQREEDKRQAELAQTAKRNAELEANRPRVRSLLGEAAALARKNNPDKALEAVTEAKRLGAAEDPEAANQLLEVELAIENTPLTKKRAKAQTVSTADEMSGVFLASLPAQVGMTWTQAIKALGTSGREMSSSPSGNRTGILEPNIMVGLLQARVFGVVRSDDGNTVRGLYMDFGANSSAQCGQAVARLTKELSAADWTIRRLPSRRGDDFRIEGTLESLQMNAYCVAQKISLSMGFKRVLSVNFGDPYLH